MLKLRYIRFYTRKNKVEDYYNHVTCRFGNYKIIINQIILLKILIFFYITDTTAIFYRYIAISAHKFNPLYILY